MTPAWAQRQEELLRDCLVSPDVFHPLVDGLRDFGVCPTFYTWRFLRVVRLTRPTVLREPYDAKSNLPSACSPLS